MTEESCSEEEGKSRYHGTLLRIFWYWRKKGMVDGREADS
jgi:hypothetical protein